MRQDSNLWYITAQLRNVRGALEEHASENAMQISLSVPWGQLGFACVHASQLRIVSAHAQGALVQYKASVIGMVSNWLDIGSRSRFGHS